ncbi:hypothetical protein [Kordiimonas sp. SCSIO 12610]|uniref:hypothetical protein n=1 Tax=Kordiimonas sp. SCSIO 12610 TaxID=2829597 RepID=UPI00210A6869|nr:hypothetical protein [Kordiimonas sp. SCSIO 12610]UTW56110.1 hypothetical protein KFF44_04230 [Kordiimonas sp. SCSIO 12610]
MVDNNSDQDQKEKLDLQETAQSLVERVLQLFVPRKFLVVIMSIFILTGFVSEFTSYTFKAWDIFTDFIGVKTTTMNSHENDVAREWVVFLDRAEEFEQINVMREIIVHAVEAHIGTENESPWSHFVRNLRMVRDIEFEGGWILVVDLLGGISCENHMSESLKSYQAYLDNPRLKDVVGSILSQARVIKYDLEKFEEFYGVASNVPPMPAQTICN